MVQYRGSIPRRKMNPLDRTVKQNTVSVPAKRPSGTPVSSTVGDVTANGKPFWTYVFPESGRIGSPGLHVWDTVGEVFVEIKYNGERMSRTFVAPGVNEMTDRVVEKGDRIELIAHSLDPNKTGTLVGTVVAFMWSAK